MAARNPVCVVPVTIAGISENFQLRPDRFFSRVTVDIWRRLNISLSPLPALEARQALGEDMSGCLGICTGDIAVHKSILCNHSMLVSRDATPTLGLISLVDSKLIYDFGKGMIFLPTEIGHNSLQVIEPMQNEGMIRHYNNNQRYEDRHNNKNNNQIYEDRHEPLLLDPRPRFPTPDPGPVFFYDRQVQARFSPDLEPAGDPEFGDHRVMGSQNLGRPMKLRDHGPDFRTDHGRELGADRMILQDEIRFENPTSRFDGPRSDHLKFHPLDNIGLRNNFNDPIPAIRDNRRDNRRSELMQPVGIPLRYPDKEIFHNFPPRSSQKQKKRKNLNEASAGPIEKVIDNHPKVTAKPVVQVVVNPSQAPEIAIAQNPPPLSKSQKRKLKLTKICRNCNKRGHLAADCRNPKAKHPLDGTILKLTLSEPPKSAEIAPWDQWLANKR